ncbi:LPS export ABC transporter permease LptG [Vibrio sp. SCSIO 43136]|uniref:LPS export ABC transporter permease LptG n=1 Tax=Vibrio sp. SCSIO 43136 TaxID=2819101 RepID=UPI00207536BE|nr:LPS export ABC transporter permease LptG [Vibrio sp. SCSIO 43136]USD65591.1 LPS export ABC transporter permease LptG [Vibrio sp. SCSIO 43136]
MFKILDIYIGRTIVATTSLCLITLVGLSAIVKYVEQLKSVGRGAYTALTAFYFTALSIPRDIELFFPMAVLLGALIGLGMLATSSELVVMQAAGFSKLDIGLSVLKTAIPIMVLVMMLGEWGAPTSQKLAREIRSFAVSGGSIVSVRSSIWAKDGNDYIFIGRADGEHLNAINVWEFDDNNQLQRTIAAEKANYLGDKDWLAENVVETVFEDEQAVRRIDHDQVTWQSSISPDKLQVVTVQPSELALSDLYSYVEYLRDSKQDPSRYELAFWRKATQPVTVAVMMFVAMSFVFGPLRSTTMGARILSGVVAGFGFYIIAETFANASLLYKLPAPVGALVPSVAFMLIAILMMRRKL